MSVEYLLRAAAIVIAILGVVDPVITMDRAVPSTVAVLDAASPSVGLEPESSTGQPALGPGPGTEGAPSSLGPGPWALGPASAALGLADQVTRDLRHRFRVVRGLSRDAAATVVVGDHLPAFADAVLAPAFAVVPAPVAGSISIRSIGAPARARFESRVPVIVSVRATGAHGRILTVRLDSAGLMQDRVERTIERDGLIDVPLTFVPAARGLAHLRVQASLASGASVVGNAGIDVDDRPWRVLFFDRRPSWTSTFVRRALEQDPRFEVESRVVTSTGVVTAAGRPPDGLGDLAALRKYDAISVGAPDVLTSADVSGLEAFARRRGGAVVVLLEQAGTGPAGALIGVSRWNEKRTAEPFAVHPQIGGMADLQASEIITPERLPPGAEALVEGDGPRGGPSPLFQLPLGAGRVLVSGLLDAWRYRGVPETSAFDAVFRLAIGRAAQASPPAVDVRTSSAVVAPGEDTTIDVTLRDVVLADPAARAGTVSVQAAMRGPAGSSHVRLWPEGGPGRFRAAVRAPEAPGTYEIAVTFGADRGAAPVVVAIGVTRPVDTPSQLLAAWASSRGGRVVPAGDVRALDEALTSVIPRVRRPTPVYPLRSAWWIVGFAAILGAEWWLRRRKNLA